MQEIEKHVATGNQLLFCSFPFSNYTSPPSPPLFRDPFRLCFSQEFSSPPRFPRRRFRPTKVLKQESTKNARIGWYEDNGHEKCRGIGVSEVPSLSPLLSHTPILAPGRLYSVRFEMSKCYNTYTVALNR